MAAADDEVKEGVRELSKLSLPATILIASIILGGFYFAAQFNKQKSIERQQQIEVSQKQQEEALELKNKEQAKTDLDMCLFKAERRYSDNWTKECKAQGKLTSDCIELVDMTLLDYMEQSDSENDMQEYFDKKESCSCRLPKYNSDHLTDSLNKLKDECFKKHPQ